LDRAPQLHRAALIGQGHRLLIGEGEALHRRIVGHVSAGGLVPQPFTHVSLSRLRALRKPADDIGPAPAIALYKPSRSPMMINAALMLAPMSSTTRARKAFSFASSMATLGPSGHPSPNFRMACPAAPSRGDRAINNHSGGIKPCGRHSTIALSGRKKVGPPHVRQPR